MKLATFDIFDTALIRKCGRPETALRMIELLNVDEMEFERGNLTANPAIKDIIGQKRKEGFTIKFLSDMYLPSYFLAEILKREGCMEDGEEVIVSCEHDARKDLGTLYDLVRKKYNPAEWIHYGDNRQSDVKTAKRKGVKSVWVDTTYTGIERRLLEKSKTLDNGWQLALLAGISRTARIMAGNTPEAILAADYVVPTYLPYVMYVLDEARRRNLDKLYFLSRDGFIMYEMAKALQPKDIELHYLFVSRKSLSSDNPLLNDYFHQEKLDEGEKGIVDVGWLGTTRKMINEHLAEMQATPVFSFYLGVRKDVLPAQYGEFVSYYDTGKLNTSETTALIEGYLSASPWPTTIGYKRNNRGEIVPKFENGESFMETAVTKANVAASHTISDILKDYSLDSDILRFWSDKAITTLSSLTEKVDLSPMTKTEGFENNALVRRLTLSEIIRMTFFGKKKWDIFEPGCYQVTFGRTVARILYKVHGLTVRMGFFIGSRILRR